MKIAITGTPGTGKTSVAKELKKDGYNVIETAEICKNFEIGYDYARKSKIVDEEKMDEYIKSIDENGILFIEGHISHLLSVDAVIILRCNPEELKKRLMKKNWEEKKIMENVEAEALDIILEKAIKKHDKIWEIDTTDKDAKTIAKKIEKLINDMPPSSYGNVDWSKWLVENAGQI
ncbi:MAG: adenylate kinase family protein [Thermoplasmata archaeon]|nr:adenylate kinase family protein [Thermoplasmata archaeon]